MGQQAAGLLNLVEVGGRFRRAVNVTRDAGSPKALDGYLVTPAVRRALAQISTGRRPSLSRCATSDAVACFEEAVHETSLDRTRAQPLHGIPRGRPPGTEGQSSVC